MEADQEQGVQPISKSLTRIVNTLEAKGPTAVSCGPNTSAISPTAKGGTKPPQVGLVETAHGAGGVATIKSGPPSVWQTDRNMEVSWPERLKTLLRSKARYDPDWEVRGYEPIEVTTEAGRAAVLSASQMLHKALDPAPTPVILKALARLKMITNQRNQDGDDARYQRAIYVEELSEFPSDVVIEACRKLGRHEDWFPPANKIRAACHELVRWRRLTAEALNG